jgi:hypothetical protein
LHLLKSFIFSTTLSSILVGSTACSACGMPRRPPRAYDHRLKEQIIRAGDPDLFPDLEIPRSTAASWIRRGLGEVVSLDSDDGGLALRDRVAKLEQRVAMLTAILRLVLALLRVSGFKLELARVPDAAGKQRLLGAIERARGDLEAARAALAFLARLVVGDAEGRGAVLDLVALDKPNTNH